MLSKALLRLFPVAAALTLAGCGASLYVPGPADATPSASLAELTAGRELYAQSCSTCHSLFLPARFSPAEWRRNLERMQPRAHISDSDKTLILKFLLAGRRRAAGEHAGAPG